MESIIKTISYSIAKEISERSLYDVDGIAFMVEQRIKDVFPLIAEEYGSKTEWKILEAKKNLPNVGTKEYFKAGVELSILKQHLTVVNRARTAAEKDNKLNRLKKFVINEYGADIYLKFAAIDNDLEEAEHKSKTTNG